MSNRTYENLVREFHEAFDRPVRNSPDVGVPSERVLRVRLMLEEVLEFARAAGVKIAANSMVNELRDLVIFDSREIEPDLTQMAHELADIQYVVSGTAVQLGIPLKACVEEVHAANMRKLGAGGKPIVDANGKVRKPEGWEPANVAKVLAGGHSWPLNSISRRG